MEIYFIIMTGILKVHTGIFVHKNIEFTKMQNSFFDIINFKEFIITV